jgi:hypothetical protein
MGVDILDSVGVEGKHRMHIRICNLAGLIWEKSV